MGGCYGTAFGYSESASRASSCVARAETLFDKFLSTGKVEHLVVARQRILDIDNSGFIAKFASFSGIEDVGDIPKEFPEIEYEVKFDMQVNGKGEEPSVVNILDAFDFPVSKVTRFLKDPVNTCADGVNNFYGNGDERLVVIEKGGNLYLKEKGAVTSLDVNVPYRDIVVKRTEKRWKAPFEEVEAKVGEVCSEPGVEYKGKIRKEKGDVFMLDSNDGRIYAFTFTRAHLIKPEETEESGIQRQIEIEYAGYLPKFPGFEENSEEQIVRGMVDLSKYTSVLYNGAPISNGWKMALAITDERKYDFIVGARSKQSLEAKARFVPALTGLSSKTRTAV